MQPEQELNSKPMKPRLLQRLAPAQLLFWQGLPQLMFQMQKEPMYWLEFAATTWQSRFKQATTQPHLALPHLKMTAL